MKNRNGLCRLAIILACTTLLFSGCGKQKESDIPFTDMNWNSTFEDVSKEYGEAINIVTSYYGEAYDYASTFENMDGYTRYTFDQDGQLTSAAFIYECEDGEELPAKYENIHSKLETKYGKTNEYNVDATTITDIWRLNSGNIMLIALISSDYNAIMYTYLNPTVSTSK